MERTVTLNHNTGLHARPASLFVKEAGKFQSDVTVEVNGKQANGKSILNLLSLAITAGQSIRIITDGPDAVEMLEHLVQLVEGNFGEA